MDNSILTTLRKLIAHEKSARAIGSVEEAEAFAAKIQELMFKHKMEMTDVEFAEAEQNEPVMSEFLSEQEITGCAPSIRGQGWIGILMQAITRANFCRAIRTARGNSYTILGKESDRAAAKALFLYLYEACVEAVPMQVADYYMSGRMAKDKSYNPYTADHVLKRTFASAFKIGFASAIADRLAVQNIALKAGVGERGLIRIDQLERKVEEKMDEMFPDRVTGGITSTKGRSGYEAGKSYGSAIGINSTKRLGA